MAEGDLFVALILAVVQGFTEWIPVSSSGHLVLLERLLGFQGGLSFSVALHFGTLMAVFVYFGKDITDIMQDMLLGRFKTQNGRMGILLIVASIPAGIVGFLAKDYFETVLSSLGVVAAGFGITGMFLLIAGTYKISKKADMKNLSYRNVLFIGLAQALSVIPGISRSGSTIASGVLVGLNEKNAMKFAFLMSIPVIFGANIIAIGNQALPSELIWASFVSFIVGLGTIHVLFKYILVKRKNFVWFGVYCLILAVVVGTMAILGGF